MVEGDLHGLGYSRQLAVTFVPPPCLGDTAGLQHELGAGGV